MWHQPKSVWAVAIANAMVARGHPLGRPLVAQPLPLHAFTVFWRGDIQFFSADEKPPARIGFRHAPQRGTVPPVD
jgi:hypothetical protein